MYPFEGMRQIGWKVARRPDSWYPFRASVKIDAPDERMLSNLPYLAGLSVFFRLLNSLLGFASASNADLSIFHSFGFISSYDEF